MRPQSTCIAVVGRPRTGTSLASGALHFLGVMMGTDWVKRGPGWHPRGSYCDYEFNFRTCLAANERTCVAVASWRQLIEERMALPLWGANCHRLLQLLPEFQAILAACHCALKIVHTERDPSHSLASFINVRPDHDPDLAAQFADLCESCIREFLPKFSGPVLSINYERATADPAAFVNQLATFAGVPANSAAIDFVVPAAEPVTVDMSATNPEPESPSSSRRGCCPDGSKQ